MLFRLSYMTLQKKYPDIVQYTMVLILDDNLEIDARKEQSLLFDLFKAFV